MAPFVLAPCVWSLNDGAQGFPADRPRNRNESMSRYSSQLLSHIAGHRARRMLISAGAAPKIRPELTKPDDMTWRDFTIRLLHIGAELEHGLMVQYLYAAYSLGGDHLSEADQEEVREWQDLILTVAREEMGHLLTVQNILCLLGGPITFERENLPWDGPFYPFPFQFEPLSRASLGAYVFAEMPGNFETLEKLYESGTTEFDRMFREKDLPFIEELAREWVTRDGAMPVGEVYHLIHDILADPTKIADVDFRGDSYPMQASWDDWGRGYHPRPDSPSGEPAKLDPNKANVIIERVATRTQALYAIREISGQGENPDLRRPANEEPSHFERFVGVLEAFDKKVEACPDWSPSRLVPCNPTTGEVSDPLHLPTGTTLISNPVSAKWANLLNCRYRMLLTYLSHTYRIARLVDPDEPNLRGAVMHRIFGEMYHLKALSGILVRLPLTEDPEDPRRAGPPFEMPYTLALPPDEIDCWRLHQDLVRTSELICGALLGDREALEMGPPEGEAYLRTLRNHDQQAIAWLDTVIAGLIANGGRHS